MDGDRELTEVGYQPSSPEGFAAPRRSATAKNKGQDLLATLVEQKQERVQLGRRTHTDQASLSELRPGGQTPVFAKGYAPASRLDMGFFVPFGH